MPKIKLSTILIDLKRGLGEEGLLSAEKPAEGTIANLIDKKERAAVRKAISNGIKVGLSENSQDIDVCYALFCELTKRNNLHDVPKENLFLKDRTILIAKHDDQIVSFMLVGDETNRWNKKTGTLIANATNVEFRNLEPNALLYWETIRFFKNKGYEYINLAGIDVQTSQEHLIEINKFKRKWGGEEITFSRNVGVLEWLYWRYLREFEIIRKLNYYLKKLFAGKGGQGKHCPKI